MSAIFYGLSVELLKEVAEHSRTDRATAYALALVSKTFNACATPILYHTVELRTSKAHRTFVKAFEPQKYTTIGGSRDAPDAEASNWRPSSLQYVRAMITYDEEWRPHPRVLDILFQILCACPRISCFSGFIEPQLPYQPWRIPRLFLTWGLPQNVASVRGATHLYIPIYTPFTRDRVPDATHIAMAYDDWLKYQGDEEEVISSMRAIFAHTGVKRVVVWCWEADEGTVRGVFSKCRICEHPLLRIKVTRRLGWEAKEIREVLRRRWHYENFDLWDERATSICGMRGRSRSGGEGR